MISRSTSELYQTLQESLQETIMAHFKTPAVSVSSHEAKRTGNAYQAIRLGDQVIPGFRSAQRDVFAGVDLKNKTVLDLGSNLGEVARDAARAGAASVRGIEYDRYFVQMARLIAAHGDLSNVSFTQGDLTKPATYKGRYDVVVALSVFAYIKDFIGNIAAMTNELLILETHAVTENWHKKYIRLLSKHFPYVAVVGMTDHKASSTSDWRYLLFCSHKPLNNILATRARDLASFEGLLTVDMARSTIGHLDKVLDTIGTKRTSPFEETLAAASAHMRSAPSDEAIAQIAKSGVVRAAMYWCYYLAGYDEYRIRGRLDSDNSYYRLLNMLVDAGVYDNAFRNLFSRSDGGVPRLEFRYKMIDQMVGDGGSLAAFEPAILYSIVSREIFPKKPAFQLFINELGETACPLAVDGHHRIFLGYVTGAKTLRVVPMWYDKTRTVTAVINRIPRVKEDIWASIYGFSRKLSPTTSSSDGTVAPGPSDG